MLTTIWQATLALAGLSVAAMAALVVNRVSTDVIGLALGLQRRAIVAALVEFGQTGDERRLLERLALASPHALAGAVFDFLDLLRGDEHAALQRVMARSDLVPHLLHQCRRKRIAVPMVHLDRLAILDATAAREPLLIIAEYNRRAGMRLSAAIVLARCGNAPPMKILLEWLGTEGQQSYRLADLFLALASQRDSELRLTATDTRLPTFTRATAIWALAASAARGLAPLLGPLIADPSAMVAVAAVRAASTVDQPFGAVLVLAGLGSPNWQVRREAIDIAAASNLRGARTALVALLKDEHIEVRRAATAALHCNQRTDAAFHVGLVA